MLDQRRTAPNLGNRLADQRLDFLRRLRAALGQTAHFAGHDRKAAALLARPRRLHGRIQREDVGLECDTVDHRNDLRDLVRTLRNAAHLVDDLIDHFAAARRRFERRLGERICLTRVVGILTHRGSQFLHAGRRFFKRCRLILRPCRKIGVAGCNFIGAQMNGVGRFAHGLHRAGDTGLHLRETREQPADFVRPISLVPRAAIG